MKKKASSLRQQDRGCAHVYGKRRRTDIHQSSLPTHQQKKSKNVSERSKQL